MAQKQTVEIVIPIYNEAAELEANIKKLHSYLQKNLKTYKWHITVADNASTDNSLSIAKRLSRQLDNVGYMHLDKKGRGRAIKKAWGILDADIFSYMDVDLSTDLNSFKPLLQALNSGFDIAIGSRLLPRSKVSKRPLKREILSRNYNLLITLFFNVHFSDAQCGFKAVTSKLAHHLLPHIRDNAWFFDSELLILADKMGYKIHEEPVLWIDNPGSTVRVLKTIYGDLSGLWRLFWDKPWHKLKKYE